MASPFSFHCMICIEEFSPSDRWPVVLPCGHTYVCNQCAERLSKCMECREPLVINDPAAGGVTPLSYRPTPTDWRARGSVGRAGQRGAHPSPQQHRPSQQPLVPNIAKKRLPLPKNVVLMSLMEATEAVPEPQIEAVPSSLSPNHNSVFRENTQLLDEYEQEEEKIRLSTSLATSACGTYVVSHPEGVLIYPSKPVEQHVEGKNENEDVDAMVRFFYLDNKMTLAVAEGEELPTVKLSKGDRVQIVSIDDGWAKLARGYGYVRAGNGQVAKVTGYVDRACKLEAMLRSITVKRKELRREQRKVDSQFVQLMNDLQVSLLNDEDLTVIGADTFAKIDSAVVVAATPSDNTIQEEDDRRKAPLQTVTSTDNNDSMGDSITDVEKPHRMVRADSPPSILPQSSLSCFSPSLFTDFGDENDSSSQPLTGCTGNRISISGIMGALSFGDDNTISDANQSSRRVMRNANNTEHPSPRAMSAGARAWRERNNRPASRGIDFRTGMSGHMALLSTHHAHRHGPNNNNNDSIMGRMSSHMGLTFGSTFGGMTASRNKNNSSRPSITLSATTAAPPSPGGPDSFDDNQTI